MGLSFLFPAALWLLLLLLPLWALALATPRRRAPAGAWISLLVRSLLIGALVLALAGTRVVDVRAGEVRGFAARARVAIRWRVYRPPRRAGP